MSNKEIINKIKYHLKLMELHGTNEFKIRTYQNAIQRIENHEHDVAPLDENELQGIDGIGKSIAKSIYEISNSGNSNEFRQLEKATPEGLHELLGFRGIAPKRLKILWDDFGVTGKEELRVVVNSGKLIEVKGFGAKTISTLSRIVDFVFESVGKVYFSEAETMGLKLLEILNKEFDGAQISFVGKLRRKWEVVEAVEILIDQPLAKLLPVLDNINTLVFDKKKSGPFVWKGITKGEIIVDVIIYPSTPEKFISNLLLKTGSVEHLNSQINGETLKEHLSDSTWKSEDEFYNNIGLAFCEPELREGDWELPFALNNKLPKLLEVEDLKGVIHTHTNYSDGQNTLVDMANACKNLRYDYIGITDHSKAASFYANGMFEERVAQQQHEIDLLNRDLAPFRIFKGIEADILGDGALDYDSTTLASFDFVVASIHSSLNMDKAKATERLITAIVNPYTTFLGHMTGRILLQRQGYPVDHQAIINACAEFGVIIEINAHPKRLDIDWRWVYKALDKGLILSINPDAHEIAGFKHMYYGVCVGRKGGITKEQTFNAWSLEKVTNYFDVRKSKIIR